MTAYAHKPARRSRPRCIVCKARPQTRVVETTRRGTEGFCTHCREVCRQATERGWTIEAWIVHAKSKCARCKEHPRGVVHSDTRACDVYLCGHCRHVVREQMRKRAARPCSITRAA